MKASALLRLAAKTIDSQISFGVLDRFGCCEAIIDARHKSGCSFLDKLRADEHLKRVGPHYDAGYWWPLDEAHRPIRVLALLFAAAIAESEGD